MYKKLVKKSQKYISKIFYLISLLLHAEKEGINRCVEPSTAGSADTFSINFTERELED